MKVKRGFGLIECLLYSVAMAGLLSLLFFVIGLFYRQMCEHIKQLTQLTQVVAACALLDRDLRVADSVEFLSCQNRVKVNSAETILWYIKNNKLIRAVWCSKNNRYTYNIVATHCLDLKITTVRNRINYILSFMYGAQQRKISSCVGLRKSLLS
jgi:type II secretory pathway component PulJ